MVNLLNVKNESDKKQIKPLKNNAQIKTNAKVLVDSLCKLNADTIFGYPGAAVLSVYNELSSSKIRHVLVRHEQAAVHMAEGYARISGKPGIVLVTSGPGFTNTVTGIANAYADSTPLVVLAGDVTLTGKSKGKVFQNVDIISMTKTCCKKNYIVHPKDDIKSVINEAYNVANTGEKGPVVVALPRTVLESEYQKKTTTKIKDYIKPVPSNSDVEKAVKLLSKAKSPLLLLGGGSVNATENIAQLVEYTNMPVVSTLMGIGTFPSDNENYLGMIGINGSYSANNALNNADLIFALGVSFSDRSTCKNAKFAKQSKIININIKKTVKKCAYNLVCDADSFMEIFVNKIKNVKLPDISNWIKTTNIYKQENVTNYSDNGSLHSSNVIKEIYKYTKMYEPVVVTDVGLHQMITAQYFNFNKPKKFITSGGLGTMGFGLPAAIGAYLADKSNLILNITGDGSFQMNLQELATCREHKIPIKIIILNNGYLGMVKQLQEKAYNKRYQVEMINPDFTKIAEAYDLFAVRVTKSEELFNALDKAIKHNGTAIVDIAIDSAEGINIF